MGDACSHTRQPGKTSRSVEQQTLATVELGREVCLDCSSKWLQYLQPRGSIMCLRPAA